MKIATYLRLSKSDGDLSENDRTESYSIENQRDYLRDYLLRHPELDGDVVEYADDGYSGTNFDRPAFQQMISDAKKGLIDVLLAKDLSRLGRDYVEMGDYLDQVFPRLGVRVIAVGSGYDSNEHRGDVSGMDAAITNFINTMYVRDLSAKHKSACRAMWKRGLSFSGMLPYGYKREKATGLTWLVDEGPAEVIKFIFAKAAQGWRIMSIVDALNEMKAELPGVRKSRLYNGEVRKLVSDEEYIWDYLMVRRMLVNPTYTGCLVAHRTEETIKVMHRIPKEDWVIIENHHVPLVDKRTFDEAQKVMIRRDWNDQGQPAIFALKKKLRCGNCRLTFRYDDEKKKFYCKHKRISGIYSRCDGREYSYPIVEGAIHRQLQKYLSDLKTLELLTKNAVDLIMPENDEKKSNGESKLKVLRAERVRAYESYAEGLITKAAYLKMKAKLTEEINVLDAEVKEIAGRIKEDRELVQETARMKRKAEQAEKSDVLTKKMVESFIANVYVHDYDRIEMEYYADDLVDRAIKRNNEIMDAVYPNGKVPSGKNGDGRYARLSEERRTCVNVKNGKE